VHAGTYLSVDGTEPAHHRALVRPDDVESRGKIGCKKKDEKAWNPVATAKPEARQFGTRPQVDCVRRICRELVGVSPRIAAPAYVQFQPPPAQFAR
jgi:hypothetical protein